MSGHKVYRRRSQSQPQMSQHIGRVVHFTITSEHILAVTKLGGVAASRSRR
jgi:hypothetical protein